MDLVVSTHQRVLLVIPLVVSLKKTKEDARIVLAVTHGIFSKGLDAIFEHIDEVYTTDSIKEFESNDRLNQYGIFIVGKGHLPKLNNK